MVAALAALSSTQGCDPAAGGTEKKQQLVVAGQRGVVQGKYSVYSASANLRVFLFKEVAL